MDHNEIITRPGARKIRGTWHIPNNQDNAYLIINGNSPRRVVVTGNSATAAINDKARTHSLLSLSEIRRSSLDIITTITLWVLLGWMVHLANDNGIPPVVYLYIAVFTLTTIALFSNNDFRSPRTIDEEQYGHVINDNDIDALWTSITDEDANTITTLPRYGYTTRHQERHRQSIITSYTHAHLSGTCRDAIAKNRVELSHHHQTNDNLSHHDPGTTTQGENTTITAHQQEHHCDTGTVLPTPARSTVVPSSSTLTPPSPETRTSATRESSSRTPPLTIPLHQHHRRGGDNPLTRHTTKN